MTSDARRDSSTVPLPKKLGVREGSRVLLVAPPHGFTLEPLPARVEQVRRISPPLDVIVLFVARRAELRRRFGKLAAALTPAGGLWIAWPKKTAGVPTDLSFETVQAIGLDAGLVDNKSASIDDTFQGLRFVVRLRDRPRT